MHEDVMDGCVPHCTYMAGAVWKCMYRYYSFTMGVLECIGSKKANEEISESTKSLPPTACLFFEDVCMCLELSLCGARVRVRACWWVGARGERDARVRVLACVCVRDRRSYSHARKHTLVHSHASTKDIRT